MMLAAVIDLADADAEDDTAYHAAWARLRYAARMWLSDGGSSSEVMFTGGKG
jgi:hypothetical protein